MPKRTLKSTNGEFYHIVKRGVEPKIFLDQQDFLRLTNSLLVFNDKNPTPWNTRSFWYRKSPDFLSKINYIPKKPLVEIHAFTLMPNHFHVLVRQITKDGVPILMQKLGGYSQYFNQKYGREGTLFQGPYKIIHIETEKQLKNTFVYIHTNQVALVESGWKQWKVKNFQNTIKFLEERYRWSSLWDYLGKENFPQLTSRKLFLELLGGPKGVRREICSWLEFKNEIFKYDRQKLKDIILE